MNPQVIGVKPQKEYKVLLTFDNQELWVLSNGKMVKIYHLILCIQRVNFYLHFLKVPNLNSYQ